MQEALMALVHRARKGDFTLTCPIDQYVLIIVRSLWLNALRADKRKPVTFIDNRLLPDMNADDQHEAEHIAAEHLRWEIFQHHLSLMPQRCQDIIKGSLSGESMQELAQQLDIDYGYLRRKKHDCLQELIKRIEADERYQQEDLA